MKRRKITLAAARVNAGLQQKQVAKDLGITNITLWKWEKGITQPNIDMAQQLAHKYGMTTDDILFTSQV